MHPISDTLSTPVVKIVIEVTDIASVHHSTMFLSWKSYVLTLPQVIPPILYSSLVS